MGEVSFPMDYFLGSRSPARALCDAEFDENGIIQRVDILSAHLLQANLEFPQIMDSDDNVSTST
jgi:hypothetical protein